MKIRRPNGWPCFVRLKSDVYSLGLTDAEDIADMTLALQAAESVAERVAKVDDSELLKLGFENEYADVAGGKVIPLLEKEADGKFAWGMTSTPAFVKDVYEKVKYTDKKLIDQLKRKGHAGIFQCCFAHVPSTWGPIDKRNYPRILILLDKARMLPIPIMQNSENETLEEYLDSLAEMLVGFGSVPSTIEVSDDATEALISDFCSKTGIKLKRVRETPEVEEVWMYLSSQL